MVLQKPHVLLFNRNGQTWRLTVFAKPPSEPKLSQLSSEEEEEDVSMGTSGELRKLLRLILVEGA